MVELKLSCSTCGATFSSDEIYSHHRQGHRKAEEWLQQNLPRRATSRRVPSPVKTVIEEPPPLSMIPHESQGAVLKRARNIALRKSSLPASKTLPIPKRSPPNLKRSPRKKSPGASPGIQQITHMPLPVTNPHLLAPVDHAYKLMECTNKRKAHKRADLGLPSLTPYYCRNFMHKECFFSSIYWASMRRHYESKHPKTNLTLPPVRMRHPCSCGKTFLEPNRLQEHMHNHGHEFEPDRNKIEYQDVDNEDEVTHWKDMIDED